MRLLLLYSEPLTKAKAGTEKVLCNMANEFVSRGHSVTVAVRNDVAGNAENFVYFIDKRVNVINVCSDNRWGALCGKIKKELGSVFCFSRDARQSFRQRLMLEKITTEAMCCLEESSYDVVVCYTPKDTTIIKNNLGWHIPSVAMFHFDFDTILRDMKVLDGLSTVDVVQVLAKCDVERVRHYFERENVVYVPNAVPQYESAANWKSKTIISVGRIDRHQKRQHILVEAFKKLCDISPEYLKWTVEIWGVPQGHSSYYKDTSKYIVDNGLEKNIHFCGLTDDVPDKLHQASIFAFPSAFEGFPLAMTEAMSMGLPVVVFKNVPGIEELVRDGYNAVVCDEGIDAFAAGLAKLMDDAEKRKKLGSQAKKDMEQYAPKVIWDKWESLLKGLCGINTDVSSIGGKGR